MRLSAPKPISAIDDAAKISLRHIQPFEAAAPARSPPLLARTRAMLAFLPGSYEHLLGGVAAIALAVALARALKWAGHRLEQRRPAEEREPLRLRRRKTALVLVATAIPYATAIVVVVVASLFVPRNAAALGGSPLVGVPRRFRCASAS
jgi:hypothetical protein